MTDGETGSMRFVVSNARLINGKEPFALVDVEVEISGIVFDIYGMQARPRPAGGTLIYLPTFKDAGGAWRPAVRLPEEVNRPLTGAILHFLTDEGILRPK
jgi:hypothetical protein